MGIEILAQEFGPERDQAMAGPLGLFVTVFLVVVTVFLIRGMNKHVKRLHHRLAPESAAAAAAAPPLGATTEPVVEPTRLDSTSENHASENHVAETPAGDEPGDGANR